MPDTDTFFHRLGVAVAEECANPRYPGYGAERAHLKQVVDATTRKYLSEGGKLAMDQAFPSVDPDGGGDPDNGQDVVQQCVAAVQDMINHLDPEQLDSFVGGVLDLFRTTDAPPARDNSLSLIHRPGRDGAVAPAGRVPVGDRARQAHDAALRAQRSRNSTSFNSRWNGLVKNISVAG
jgi:hypothetical protein